MPPLPGYNAFQFGQGQGPPPKRPNLQGLAPAPTPTPLHLQRPAFSNPKSFIADIPGRHHALSRGLPPADARLPDNLDNMGENSVRRLHGLRPKQYVPPDMFPNIRGRRFPDRRDFDDPVPLGTLNMGDGNLLHNLNSHGYPIYDKNGNLTPRKKPYSIDGHWFFPVEGQPHDEWNSQILRTNEWNKAHNLKTYTPPPSSPKPAPYKWPPPPPADALWPDNMDKMDQQSQQRLWGVPAQEQILQMMESGRVY